MSGSSLNKLMNKLLPIILQQEMQRQMTREQAQIWLDKSLREYKAYGDIQEQEHKRIQARDLFNKVVQPEFFQKYPDAAYRIIDYINQTFPDLKLPLPEDFPRMKARGDEAATRIAIAKQAGEDINPEDLKIYAQSRGITEPLETVGEITKARAEKETMGIRGKELDEATASRLLRGEELEVRREEVGLKEKGEKANKELKKDLEKKINDRQNYIEKLRSLSDRDIKNVRTHEIKIDELNSEIRGLKKTLGIETDIDKKYKSIVEALRTRGIARERLLTDKELEKDLMAKGYQKWIILEYF